MKKDTEMKSSVLQNLIEAMLGETGGKMKPKMVTIEIIKPVKKGEGSLEEVLDEASEAESMEEAMGDVDGDGDHDMHDHALEKEAEMYEDAEEGMEEDEEDEDKKCGGGKAKGRMSLQEFLSRK